MNFEETEKEFNQLMKHGHELIEKLKKGQKTESDEETIRLNREDLKDLKEKGFITREHIADVSKTKRWKPKDGDVYYGVVADGNIKSLIWDTDIVDNGYYKMGNCFKTEEEAQKDIDRRIAEQKLLDLCDWKTGLVYYIEYNKANKFFDIDWCFTFTSPYRFASEKSAQKAIKQLGEDKLKLIFRID